MEASNAPNTSCLHNRCYRGGWMRSHCAAFDCCNQGSRPKTSSVGSEFVTVWNFQDSARLQTVSCHDKGCRNTLRILHFLAICIRCGDVGVCQSRAERRRIAIAACRRSATLSRDPKDCVSLPCLHFHSRVPCKRREMNMNTEAILALPAAEKLELIGLLWDASGRRSQRRCEVLSGRMDLPQRGRSTARLVECSESI